MKRAWMIAMLVGLVCGLAYWLPASLFINLVTRDNALADALTWDTVSGRIWDGEIRGLQFNDQFVDHLQWEWQPDALLTGALGVSATVTAYKGQAEAEIRVHPNAISAHALSFSAPASVIAQEWVPWPLIMEGTIQGSAEFLRYEWRDRGLTAMATVRWSEAASGYPQPAHLGWLQADIANGQTGDNLQIKLKGDQRFLAVNGGVDVQPNGEYTMTVLLAPGIQAGANLLTALQLLGYDKTEQQKLEIRSTGVLARGGIGFPTIQ